MAAGQQPPAIAQALEALANLTRASRTRQEAAAVSGVVPHLVRLAQAQVRPSSPGTPFLSSFAADAVMSSASALNLETLIQSSPSQC